MDKSEEAGPISQPVILITGCSSGIGYAAATALRSRGWRVFAACRKDEDCQRLQGLGFDSPRLDYADEDSIHGTVSDLLAQTNGRLDAVFNNGAFAIPGAVEDLPTDALRHLFEANFFGWHTLTRAVLPVMQRQGHGRIVQCSSVLGFAAMRWRGAYVATKYALEGLTDTMRLELQDTPIRVSLIEPGPITSQFRNNATVQFEHWIRRQESRHAATYETQLAKRRVQNPDPDPFELPPVAVVEKLIHAVESERPRARYYVTVPTHIIGMMRRFLPTSALDWLLRRSA